MQKSLAGCPNLRVVVDMVPEHLLFIYRYFTDDLLELAGKENLPDIARKRILRDTLTGRAHLHDRNIFHSGKQLAPLFTVGEVASGASVRSRLTKATYKTSNLITFSSITT